MDHDGRALWVKDPPALSLSGLSRFRRWLFPALTAVVVLVLIIALGATNANTSSRLWSAEQSVSNLSDIIQSLNASLQQAHETAKAVKQLQFAVDNNKDQLNTVSEALKQLSVVDSLSKNVALLKCSLERIINNSTSTEPHHHSIITARLHTPVHLFTCLSVCVPVCLSGSRRTGVVLWTGNCLAPVVISSVLPLCPGTSPETGVRVTSLT
uniref:Uncharacterized protein n=1 Tax=Lates calcarifer TaxID=8187 RepID=A0A4W6EES4_LATCA